MIRYVTSSWEKKNLTLEKCLEILRTTQVTTQRAQEISTDESETTHAVRHKFYSKARNTASSDIQEEHCTYCGLNHPLKKSECPAADKICLKCKKKGHYARVCRSRQTPTAPQEKTVKHVEQQEDVKYVHLNQIHTTIPSKAFATFKVLEKPVDIQFQIDTGASCNVIPFTDYIRATGDKSGQKLSRTNTILVMHNSTQVRP